MFLLAFLSFGSQADVGNWSMHGEGSASHLWGCNEGIPFSFWWSPLVAKCDGLNLRWEKLNLRWEDLLGEQNERRQLVTPLALREAGKQLLNQQRPKAVGKTALMAQSCLPMLWEKQIPNTVQGSLPRVCPGPAVAREAITRTPHSI